MNTSHRVGSLFSGVGALDLAVHQVFDADSAWFVENDSAASRVLAHHWPDVPNYGDVTAVDWDSIEQVRILTGGFPCTDISLAGKRAGMRPSTRSGLWTHMAYAISVIRPEIVVIENVRGILSQDAHCDLEPCPWCVGDLEQRPLRALGGVLGDLANLGYDARWCGLRAADVGAPHGRYRVFIVARFAGNPADIVGERGWQVHGIGSGGPGQAGSSGSLAIADTGRLRLGPGWTAGPGEASAGQSLGDIARRGEQITPHATGNGRGEGRPEPAWIVEGSDAALGGDAPAANSGRTGSQGCRVGRPAGAATFGDDPSDSVDPWGEYGPAIRRWERILGRSAPSPTKLGKRGGQQLSPSFAEWMMGWPEGWVTGVPGLSRNDQLKLCGNGVVVQQAVPALRHLMDGWILAP